MIQKPISGSEALQNFVLFPRRSSIVENFFTGDDAQSADFTDEKSTSVVVGGKGVGVHTGKPGKHTDVGVGKGGVSVNTGGKGGGTHVEVGKKGGVGVSTGKPGRHTNVGVGKGGVSVSTGHKGKPVYVGVRPGANPFLYLYAATQDQLQHDPNVALFFLEKDMRAGEKMNLHFFQSATAATFLPRQIADAIPFSSAKLPAILNQFSVQPDSKEACHVWNSRL